jgi:hypothetical protein
MKKLLLPILLMSVVSLSVAQQRKTPKLPKFNKNKERETFLNKQWFLGVKAGVNLSGADVIKEYAVINPTNYQTNESAKQYRNFKDVGTQVSFEATFYFTGLSLSFQPTYRHNRFGYTNDFEWTDAENPNNRLVLKYDQEQNIDYFDLPVLAKYEKMFNKFSPYIQGGVYYSFLANATKSVEVSGTDYASGGMDDFRNETIIVGATDLFARRHWGFVGGAGVYFNQGNVRFNLDIQYRLGMSNIASTENRFESDRLSGVGDTLDDMKLRSASLSLGCLFPLRFLGRNFRSTDNKK